MNRTALIAVSLSLAVAAIGLPTWAVLAVDRDVARMPSFQLMANASCACERRAKNTSAGDACWRRFERLTQTDHHQPNGGTTCYPLSESSVLVGEGSENSVILRYNVGPSRSELYLCSREEAVIGEAIWYRPFEQARNETEYKLAQQRGDEALIRFAERLKRDEWLEKRKPAMSCVTGHY